MNTVVQCQCNLTVLNHIIIIGMIKIASGSCIYSFATEECQRKLILYKYVSFVRIGISNYDTSVLRI